MSSAELSKMLGLGLGVEGRFSKRNSVCSGHGKFELRVGHLSGTGEFGIKSRGLASIPQGKRSRPRVPSCADPPCRVVETGRLGKTGSLAKSQPRRSLGQHSAMQERSEKGNPGACGCPRRFLLVSLE